MPTAQLARGCAIDGLAEQLAAAGVLGDSHEPLVLTFPRSGAIHPSALTFLCAWGRRQRRLGRHILFRGDQAALGHLTHLGLYDLLGLAYQAEARAATTNPLVPLRLISNEQDMVPAAAAVEALVTEHFENAPDFLPALRWVIQESLDNVLRHADATEPGAIYAEYAPRQHRLDVAICDLGQGIYASLGATAYLYSHGHAITQAVRRGVTRSEDIGQGNGLAGLLEIVKRNGSGLQLWTGNAVYRVVNGEERGFTTIPALPGTGIAFSLDTRVPVDLQDTWIASRSPGAVIGASRQGSSGHEPIAATPARAVSTGEAGRTVDVASECASTGMRGPAQRLRERLRVMLDENAAPIVLDFGGVRSATSSFLDELLGRLALELGPEQFARRVRIVRISDLVERMADVVMRQRTSGTSTTRTTPEGGGR